MALEYEKTLAAEETGIPGLVVLGDGKNFVKTMAALSDRITGVGDQIGRLTFTSDMTEAALHVLGYRAGSPLPLEPAPCGAYNLTGAGERESWAGIAREVFDLRNGNGNAAHRVKTSECYATAQNPSALRPHRSTLDLAKWK